MEKIDYKEMERIASLYSDGFVDEQTGETDDLAGRCIRAVMELSKEQTINGLYCQSVLRGETA